MLVKSGQALISFENPENAKNVMKKYPSFLLDGFLI